MFHGVTDSKTSKNPRADANGGFRTTPRALSQSASAVGQAQARGETSTSSFRTRSERKFRKFMPQFYGDRTLTADAWAQHAFHDCNDGVFFLMPTINFAKTCSRSLAVPHVCTQLRTPEIYSIIIRSHKNCSRTDTKSDYTTARRTPKRNLRNASNCKQKTC